MCDEFFDIVASNPMTDEEADKRLSNISPHLLPGWKGVQSFRYAGRNEYDSYFIDYSRLCEEVVFGKNWTAEQRKRLIDMENR